MSYSRYVVKYFRPAIIINQKILIYLTVQDIISESFLVESGYNVTVYDNKPIYNCAIYVVFNRTSGKKFVYSDSFNISFHC